MTKKDCISIVVPCYNEQEALPLFYDETLKVLAKMDVDYEILLVNDGSKDDTLKIMKDLANKNEKVIYVSFSRNFGKEAAMYAGIKNAKGNYVVYMDADMQELNLENMIVSQQEELIEKVNHLFEVSLRECSIK